MSEMKGCNDLPSHSQTEAPLGHSTGCLADLVKDGVRGGNIELLTHEVGEKVGRSKSQQPCAASSIQHPASTQR